MVALERPDAAASLDPAQRRRMSSTLTARSAVVHQRVNATVRMMRLDVSRDVVDSRWRWRSRSIAPSDDDDDGTRTRRHRSRLAMMMMMTTMTRAWRARVMVDARM
jgi:hypothetical protein